MAKNFWAVSPDNVTQGPLAQGTLGTIEKQENQTDFMEDEELREKLKRKTKLTSFQVCDEAIGTSQSLSPQSRMYETS